MPARTLRRGFSLPEILTVVGVIVVLLGLLLPALAAVRKTGLMTQSMSNMSQIGQWIQMYARDNREQIVPSQFDYTYYPYPGKVRSHVTSSQLGEAHQGTWTDILWTVFEVGVFPESESDPDTGLSSNYRLDSPDTALYEFLGHDIGDNPFRSAARNTKNAPRGTGPTPFGTGAFESGQPGYFAANDFFNVRCDIGGTPNDPAWYVTTQIRAPQRSMYLVDSFYGEVIPATEEAFDNTVPASPNDDPTGQVDFRYADVCLMLFMDNHVSPENKWADLADLQENRQIRVQDLHLN